MGSTALLFDFTQTNTEFMNILLMSKKFSWNSSWTSQWITSIYQQNQNQNKINTKISNQFQNTSSPNFSDLPFELEACFCSHSSSQCSWKASPPDQWWISILLTSSKLKISSKGWVMWRESMRSRKKSRMWLRWSRIQVCTLNAERSCIKEFCCSGNPERAKPWSLERLQVKLRQTSTTALAATSTKCLSA